MPYLYHTPSFQYVELRNSLVIGRNDGDLAYPEDVGLSGDHLRLELIDGEVYAEDLKSKNGTLIGRREIVPGRPHKVPLLSVLEVGFQRFILCDGKLRLDVIDEILSKNAEKSVIKLGPNDLLRVRLQDEIEASEALLKRRQENFALLAGEISSLEKTLEGLRAEIEAGQASSAALEAELEDQRIQLALLPAES